MSTSIRTTEDVEEIISWREEVVRCVFSIPEGKDVGQLMDANLRYVRDHVRDGTFVLAIASEDGADVGCGAMCQYDEMPSPDNPSGRCAYLMNVYTRAAFRGKGVATSVVNFLTDEARRRGCGKTYLETTADAERMYEKAGFVPMKGYMRRPLE